MTALVVGFVNEPVGTHTSRTMMLRELTSLLHEAPAQAGYNDYQRLALDLNSVQKATLTTRQKTLRHLRELYALNLSVPIFAALRTLWDHDSVAQPLLAGLCAVARDPVLRCTLAHIVELRRGEETTPGALAAMVAESFPGHYGPDVTARIGRNIASSWAQTGLLTGRTRKVRSHPDVNPTTVAYALFLAHLCGGRGDMLFSSLWSRMLDTPIPEVRSLASAAARQGWLEYRESGGITEVTFRHFEQRLAEREL